MENPSFIVPLSENNIAYPENSPQEQQLVKTLSAFSHWRTNKKKPAELIPSELWHQIFALEEWYTPSQLRSFFSVSKKQYAMKREALMAVQNEVPKAATKPDKATAAVDFDISGAPELCEVNVINEKKTTKKNTAKINPYALESLPSAKTLVVEFCRSDGQIMKIHTTQDSIPTLLQTFLGGEILC